MRKTGVTIEYYDGQSKIIKTVWCSTNEQHKMVNNLKNAHPDTWICGAWEEYEPIDCQKFVDKTDGNPFRSQQEFELYYSK